MNIYKDRIEKLRVEMNKEGIAAYIVFTNDFHGSEYVGDYFKVREYLSGFTGSAGTLLIRENEALLWTDGRYFIQAERELLGSGIKLMKQGLENVPTIFEYLANVSDFEEVIGFDGRCASLDFVQKLDEELEGLGIVYEYEKDLVDRIWKDRPELSAEKVWFLPLKYSGEESEIKIRKLIDYTKDNCADFCIITALDEIAWLLNLRGNDIAYNPVFLSYMIVGADNSILYINKDILDDTLKGYLQKLNISVKPYNDFYTDLSELGNVTVILDRNKINFRAYMSLDENAGVVELPSVITDLKAIKNTVEIDNIKKAHIKDGIAVTRFIYRIKHLVNQEEISELKAAELLEEFKKVQEGYIGPSFETIMAYGSHGAIVHYSANDETAIPLKPYGLLLFDAGGHFLEGTTDITRTIALGNANEDEKKAFTLVLKGHLRLANAVFPYRTSGAVLDGIAREPLWREGLDFNHGTGHGVGYLLNVHEGPNSFQFRRTNATYILPGMVTSDEPGLYFEGRFGIRHESLILCKESSKNKNFYEFEYLTMVPFDKECIVLELLEDNEIEYLNEYHRQVFENISPYFDGEELEWLEKVTAPIKR